ncbi:MAG: hypothetical protein NVS3B3_21700 [Aquirhabdus sp.]
MSVIHIVGLGYGIISKTGYDALSAAKYIISAGEFGEEKLRAYCPQATMLYLDSRMTFLEPRVNYYNRAAEEIRLLVTQYGEVTLPTVGNPFFLEGISAYLGGRSELEVKIHVAPSVVDVTLQYFPLLCKGGGYRVVDTSENFFSLTFDPLSDLILVQLARAGSKRQTFDYTPTSVWLNKFFTYLGRTYPPDTMIHLVEFSEQGATIKAHELDFVSNQQVLISPWTTVVLCSPYKEIEDTEESILARLNSPLEHYVRICESATIGD